MAAQAQSRARFDGTTTAARLEQERRRHQGFLVIQLSEPVLGFKKSFLVRDPDAHAMQLVEK